MERMLLHIALNTPLTIDWESTGAADRLSAIRRAFIWCGG